jgi:CDP-diacylglycerol pyrophosphatase
VFGWRYYRAGLSKPKVKIVTGSLLKVAAPLFAAIVVTSVAASSTVRSALWPVVQSCIVNHELTGSSFPCLEVNVARGVERGNVVLRPPLGIDDDIFVPTKKIVGIEDPLLLATGAPNYFDDAWKVRSILRGSPTQPPDRSNVALAVNSARNRTQDQLHIHLGCVPPRIKKEIQEVLPSLPPTRWQRLDRPLGGVTFWAYRIDQETLADVNPFRLASTFFPPKELRTVSLFVAGTETNINGGFVIFATTNGLLDCLLDKSCTA